MYDYEDFYDEPSEFDEKMEELKESLMKSVKEEFIGKMNQLQEENRRLQGIKEHFEQIKKDYECKKYECDRIAQSAKENARRMRAEEVMETYKLVLWHPRKQLMYGPKCSKCNKSRNITITLPSGNTVQDECECQKRRSFVMIPVQTILHEIENRDYRIVAYYKEFGKEKDKYYELQYASSIYSENGFVKPGTDFSTLKENKNILFEDRESCLEYCKYINKENEVEEDIVYNLDGSIYNQSYKKADD